MGVSYIHGLNDNFKSYTASDTIFGRLRGLSPNTVRLNISWNSLTHATGPQTLDFSSYMPLLNRLAPPGLPVIKVLPILHGVPSWTPIPNQPPPNETKPYDLKPSNNWHFPDFFVSNIEQKPGPLAPRNSLLDGFGQYAVQLFDYFSAVSFDDGRVVDMIDAVEVWNEPNIDAGQSVPKDIFQGMVYAVGEAAFSRNNPPSSQTKPAKQMRVVTGGVGMGANSDWKNYLHYCVDNACIPLEIGIHPYYFVRNVGIPYLVAAANCYAAVSDLYNQAETEFGNRLWVTEMGCTSDLPYYEAGQASALIQLCGAGTSRFFESKASSSCKAVFIHDLLDLGPTLDTANATHNFNLVNGQGGDSDASHTTKQAYSTIASAWS